MRLTPERLKLLNIHNSMGIASQKVPRERMAPIATLDFLFCREKSKKNDEKIHKTSPRKIFPGKMLRTSPESGN